MIKELFIRTLIAKNDRCKFGIRSIDVSGLDNYFICFDSTVVYQCIKGEVEFIVRDEDDLSFSTIHKDDRMMIPGKTPHLYYCKKIEGAKLIAINNKAIDEQDINLTPITKEEKQLFLGKTLLT